MTERELLIPIDADTRELVLSERPFPGHRIPLDDESLPALIGTFRRAVESHRDAGDRSSRYEESLVVGELALTFDIISNGLGFSIIRYGYHDASRERLRFVPTELLVRTLDALEAFASATV